MGFVADLRPQLAGMAARALRDFAGGKNARLPDSGTVHEIGVRTDQVLGMLVPHLKCPTAVGNWDWLRLLPTDLPVNCGHCRPNLTLADRRGGVVQLALPLVLV